jgi:hypothetical protein
VQSMTVSDKPGGDNNVQGPTGFLELGGNVLVVDYGNVFMDGTAVGYLYEDGYLKNPGSESEDMVQWRLIDEVEGCVFRGIDSSGIELTLPTSETGGPTGNLEFNNLKFTVINGRITTEDHRIVGEFDDSGTITLRDRKTKVARRKLDEHTLLSVYFDGVKGNGNKWRHEFYRPLYRKDKPYYENEIIRYFQDYDKLSMQQKKYVLDSLQIWASSGLLQVVRKSEGNAALGNVKHGAAGVTRVRSGMVDLDREEFDRDIDFFKRFGALAVVSTRFPPHVEVRVNLVVSHEFGHQLQFCLSQATVDRIDELYQARLKRSHKVQPPPSNYDGAGELCRPENLPNRLFISGYAKSSKEEYWAECVAAFSVPESRNVLRQMDPGICKILTEVIYNSEATMSHVYTDQLMDLQTALKVGGEFTEGMLS